MRSVIFVALAAGALPLAAFGQNTVSHSCSLGDLTRRVEIVYEPGRRVPCEVHYYKDTEAPGEKQVLWSAASQEGYCEQQADAFVARLEGWGWDCNDGGTAPAASSDEPAPETEEAAPAADQTVDLAPAEPEAE